MALVLLLTLVLKGGLPVPLVNGTPVEPTLKQYLAMICVGRDCVSSFESWLPARYDVNWVTSLAGVRGC